MRRSSLFYGNVVPGLEGIAADEAVRKLPGVVVRAQERGRIWLDYRGPLTELLKLGTIEEALVFVGEILDLAGDESDLTRIEQELAAFPLDGALAALAELRDLPPAPSFRVTATRKGTQPYTSLVAASYAGSGVQRQRGWRVDLRNHDIDIWLDIRGPQAVVGIRLTAQALSRRARVLHGVASLNPTVAYAMCLLSAPGPGEFFLDPMCGTGTLLIERARAGPSARIVGTDRDSGVLATARINLAAAGVPGLLARANAVQLPVPTGSVDKLVCNLPWGRRVGTHAGNRRLYPRFLAEVGRVVKSGGSAVLLSAERRLMTRSLEQRPDLEVVSRTVVNLGGLEPTIYLVRRR